MFCELIRTALHHIADEETTLLPLAEVRLKDQLRELGWEMAVRRFELLKPRMGEAATTTVMTFPVLTGAAARGCAWQPGYCSGEQQGARELPEERHLTQRCQHAHGLPVTGFS